MLRWGLVLLTTLVVGCAHHAVRPPKPVVLESQLGLAAVTLSLRAFEVSGLGRREGDAEVRRLRVRFLDYLAARSRFAAVFDGEPAPPTGPVLYVDVRVRLSSIDRRTFILDALTLGVLAPSWGRVYAHLAVDLSTPDGKLAHWEHSDVQPYSAVWWTWFRRGYVERAFTAASRRIFEKVASELAVEAPRLALAIPGAAPALVVAPTATPEPGVAAASPGPELALAGSGPATALVGPAPATALVAPAPEPPSTSGLPAPDTAPAAASVSPTAPATAADERPRAPAEATLADVGPTPRPPEPWVEVPPGEAPEPRYGLIREPLRNPTTLTGRVLNALGGLEGQAIFGAARVSSKVKDASGNPVEIAAGAARQRGYGAQLYAAPRTTGVFIGPQLGYLYQSIDIADFRKTLPEHAAAVGQDIGAVCSNPATLASFDCSDPNVYGLVMESGYLGARAGFHLVAGGPAFVFFSTVSVGANALEYRRIEASIGNTAVQRTGFDFFKSASAGLALGFELPKAHLALRVAGDYEYYAEFRYRRPLQFEGDIVFNEEKQHWERPLRYVTAASLTSWTVQCALAVIY